LRGAAVAKSWRCREQLLGKAAEEEEKAWVMMELRRRSMLAAALAMARIPMGRVGVERLCWEEHF
jgi:hypothetical protein